MLDGRQVAVIARYLTGDAQGTLAIVQDTVTTEPWEDLVSSCLTALCALGHSIRAVAQGGPGSVPESRCREHG